VSTSSDGRSISGSVGRKGRNRHDDVVTVQKLLNRTRPTQGGPSPLLDVDGLAGPKTIAAIQKFQLHHFGFKGADGRVDPKGPTIRKLNELASPETSRLLIRRVGFFQKGGLDPEDHRQWFFQVRPSRGAAVRAARYYLGRRSDLRRLRTPVNFFGTDERFTVRRGRNFDELAGRAIYSTLRRGPVVPGTTHSHLTVGSAAGLIFRELMIEHITLPPPKTDPFLPSINPNAARSRQGEFILVA
jgi:peptidoglycan hydrolase-like protein with peptidoglycan-binding domain